ncbi:MAG: ferredoxin [Paludibacteraceae bacterium]|nr:ferredoxin [Paludibacteraceae bacterium]
MLINERENRRERLLTVANAMMTAARTAPKGKGIDIIEVAMATDETIQQLSQAMIRYSEKSGLKFFLRDAENILQAEAIVLIGSKRRNQNLNCSYCGFETCAAKDEFSEVPCAVNTVDVGIAIGSACAVAADHRVDSRVMFSVGRAAIELGMLAGCTSVYGIPISSTSKNPFFDRVSKNPVQK